MLPSDSLTPQQPLPIPPTRSTATRAAKNSSSSASSDAGGGAGGLGPGKLISFSKDGKAILLGLVTEPDGKSKWFVIDSRGHRSSLQPKAASLVLPGGGYTPDDLNRFSTAAAGADASLLEIAWAIAAEDDGSSASGTSGGGGTSGTSGVPLSLAELASLLYDADGALEQWTTYWLLHHDKVYFKQSVSHGRLGWLWSRFVGVMTSRNRQHVVCCAFHTRPAAQQQY